jgi:uncharacterized protein (TIGR03435 family)
MKLSSPSPSSDEPVGGESRFREPAKDNAGFAVIPEFYNRGRRFMAFGDGKASVRGRQQSLADVVKLLSSEASYDVIDRTGLMGEYDFLLNWYSDRYHTARDPLAGPPEGVGADFSLTIFDALKRQLGLPA